MQPVRPSDVIEVRPFDPATDADAVAQAIVDSSIWHVGLEPERYQVLDPATVADDYRHGRQHRTGGNPDEQATLVAELAGQVVGVADLRVVYPAGAHQALRYGEIAELAVATHARRHGVGTALVAAAEAWARERDCAYAVLDYNAYNSDAGRFYRDRLGYRPAGEIVLKKL
jgi:GNAT superfamily N-acetyltransferase